MRNTFSSMLLLSALLVACAPTTDIRVAPTGALVTEAVSVNHGKDLVDRGKVVEAITVFRTLLRDDGPSLPVLNGLAIAHGELGRPDLAAGFFAKALAIAPDDPATLNNIGYAALRRNEPDLARRYLERADQVGNGALKISGNLKVLERLETWQPPPMVIGAAAIDQPDIVAVVLERQTASSVRLSGLDATSDETRSRPDAASPPRRAMIDFSELFDPWSPSEFSPEPPS